MSRICNECEQMNYKLSSNSHNFKLYTQSRKRDRHKGGPIARVTLWLVTTNLPIDDIAGELGVSLPA